MSGDAAKLTLKDLESICCNNNVLHAYGHTGGFRNYSWMIENDFYLALSGEASAGKSSLINLILGERLLPSSSLSTTSTLCELKYGEERQIVAHLKDTDSKTGLTSTMFLENPTESSGKSYLQQISPFVHVKGADRGKGTIYKKVEIFWPHQLLKVSIQ